MYPLAPVSRMREVLGIAAGFGTMVGGVLMSGLTVWMGTRGGMTPPRVPQLFLLQTILDQIPGGQVFLVFWFRCERFFNEGHGLRVLFSTHGD